MGLMFDWDQMSARIRVEAIGHDCEELLLEIASGLDQRILAGAIEGALTLPSNSRDYRTGFERVREGCGLLPCCWADGAIGSGNGLQDKKMTSLGKLINSLALRPRRDRKGVMEFWGGRPSWETVGVVFVIGAAQAAQ